MSNLGFHEDDLGKSKSSSSSVPQQQQQQPPPQGRKRMV